MLVKTLIFVTFAASLVHSQECVSHNQLMEINAESGYWPQCDPSQATKGSATGYEFGYYCTQEWTNQLNEMLRTLGYCDNIPVIRNFLAQVAYETGYYSTLGQPLDNGSGIIHMIPQNWGPNVADMEQLFPGEGIQTEYNSRSQTDRKNFFKEPKYAFKSAAAWFKLTNRVIPGCGRDLFPLSLDEQTKCILGRVVSRNEALTLVSKHIVGAGGSNTSPQPVQPTTQPPTVSTLSGGETNSNAGVCGTCTGCLWAQHNACYQNWPQSTCNLYAPDYVWCGSGSGTGSSGGNTGNSSPTTAAPSQPQPTVAPAPPTQPTPQPTSSSTATKPGVCGNCDGCLWEQYNACYPSWPQTTCNLYAPDYVWCGSGGGGGGGNNNAAPTHAGVTPTQRPTPQPTTRPLTSPTTPPTTFTLPPSSFNNPDDNAAGWLRVMTPDILAAGHPWGISNFGPAGLSGIHAAQAIFDDIVTALREGPVEFASFCNSGNLENDKREAAGFLANVLKETGGYSAFVEVSPAGTYCTHNGEGGSDLIAAGVEFKCGAPFASEGYANEFIGRGAIQLTWNINYGRFSEFYFGDRDVLLKNPSLVEGDGPLGWAASLWFWTKPQDYGGQCPPKQLDSTMPLGTMSCHSAFASPVGGGMGQTIRIINGGYESCPTSSFRSSAVARVKYYLELTSLLNVAPAANAGCTASPSSIESGACDIAGMQEFSSSAGTIGNVLIGDNSSPSCERCRRVQCSSKVASKWLGTASDPVQKTTWECN